MNGITFLFLAILPFSVPAQKYTVKKGEIQIASHAELELIRASSDKLQGILDAATQQFAFQVAIASFRGFNSELQRVHFNEKYMESDLYPKATFMGKIIEPVDFTTDGIHELRAKGELDIHGQKQTRIIRVKVTLKQGTMHVESAFKVPLSDHNISIPSIVNQKIATEIEIYVKASLSQ